jgi:lipopolysaccharide transport system ATP-binding protein
MIKLEDVSKMYRLGLVGSSTLQDDLKRRYYKLKGKEDPFLKIGEENKRDSSGGDYVWALKDINIEVAQGEVLGIIGGNGAGKSTLLKLLSKVTKPTTGSIKTRGRLASLLEVGTGFHPELTGRENIFLNGAILGMKKHEIKSQLDEIISFSGCERYIDTPVKRYSSGMYVRLAFAVAAHLEPEILVVDEVLAVGDIEFQQKAIGKMKEVSQGKGRTVLFVSHNMASISSLCTSTVVMNKGQVSFQGETDEGITHFLKLQNSLFLDKKYRSGNLIQLPRKGTGLLKFNKIAICNSGREIQESAVVGKSTIFEINYSSDVEVNIKNTQIDIGINNSLGNRVAWFSTSAVGNNIDVDVNTKGNILLIIDKLPFFPGEYSVTLFAKHKGIIADWIKDAYYFNVLSGDFFGTGRLIKEGQGDIIVDHSFKIKKA